MMENLTGEDREAVRQWLEGGPMAAELRQDPHALLDRLRAAEPIHRAESGKWILSRHEDVRDFLRDNTMLLAAGADVGADAGIFLQHTARSMLNMNDPDHGRLRKLVRAAFTPLMAAQWSPLVEETTDRLLDQIRDRGKADLLPEVCYPLPILVISRLLGLPEDLTDLLTQIGEMTVRFNSPDPKSPEFFVRADEVFSEYRAWILEIADQKRRAPDDTLMAALVQSLDKSDGQMTETELVSLVTLLHIAGHETTANLIGSVMFYLLTEPGRYEKVRRDPELVHGAVEETLRMQPSATSTKARVVPQDMAFKGHHLLAGDRVYAVTSLANRDPEFFDDPHTFDLKRTPNEHLAFGFGAHYCLGVHLARVEARGAVSRIVRALPELRLARPPEEFRWRDIWTIRGLEELPVRWGG